MSGMANLPLSLVSLSAALVAMLVVAVLVVAGRNAATGTHGWRQIRPSAMHWTGLLLCGGLALLMGYIWFFVGSSRPDGAQQMRILFWLTLFFAVGSALMGWAILQVRRAAVEWRGKVIAFRTPEGDRGRRPFEEVVSVRKDLLGRAVIAFVDGQNAKLDLYAQGADQLLEALDKAGRLQRR